MVESTGLENRRPFTRSKGSNPFPSATFSLLSSWDSMSVVHWWSTSSGPSEVLGQNFEVPLEFLAPGSNAHLLYCGKSLQGMGPVQRQAQ